MAEYGIQLCYCNPSMKETNGAFPDTYQVMHRLGHVLYKEKRLPENTSLNLLLDLVTILAAFEIKNLEPKSLVSSKEKDKEQLKRIRADFYEVQELHLLKSILNRLKESGDAHDRELLNRINELMETSKETYALAEASLA